MDTYNWNWLNEVTLLMPSPSSSSSSTIYAWIRALDAQYCPYCTLSPTICTTLQWWMKVRASEWKWATNSEVCTLFNVHIHMHKHTNISIHYWSTIFNIVCESVYNQPLLYTFSNNLGHWCLPHSSPNEQLFEVPLSLSLSVCVCVSHCPPLTSFVFQCVFVWINSNFT